MLHDAVTIQLGRTRTVRRAYGIDEIALVPGGRTVDPAVTDSSWTLGGITREIPIIASAMDGVVDVAMCVELTRQGALGVLNLGESLSPLPEPIPGAALITEGAYGRCRHPLYQSLLLCSLGVVLLLGSLLHLGLLLALATVLALKARREEQRLCLVHADYPAYQHRTPAILPFVPGLDWRGTQA
jgi:protein-S-isoprenylcysteine O-methyltransferase Ste14